MSVDGEEPNLGGSKHGGDVHQKAVPVFGHHLQRGAVGLRGLVSPGDADPAVLILLPAVFHRRVGAVRPVDGHAVALGDEADDVVARYRITAFRYADFHILVTFCDDNCLFFPERHAVLFLTGTDKRDCISERIAIPFCMKKPPVFTSGFRSDNSTMSCA